MGTLVGLGRFEQRKSGNRSPEAGAPPWECLEARRPQCFERELVGAVDSAARCRRRAQGTLGVFEREGPTLGSLTVASGWCPHLSDFHAPTLATQCWNSLSDVLWPSPLLEDCTLDPILSYLPCSRRSARWPVWTSAARWRWCGLTIQRPSSCPRYGPAEAQATWLTAVVARLEAVASLLSPLKEQEGSQLCLGGNLLLGNKVSGEA